MTRKFSQTFSKVYSDDFYIELETIFKDRMKKQFVEVCRHHNERVASKYIKIEQEGYLEVKRKIVLEYKEKYDENIDEKNFIKL